MIDPSGQPRETPEPNSVETPTTPNNNPKPHPTPTPTNTSHTTNTAAPKSMSYYNELQSLQQQTIHGYAITRNNVEAYGDVFEVKPPQTIRLVFQNVQGLTAYANSDKSQLLVRKLELLNPDVCGIIEAGLLPPLCGPTR